MRPIIYSGQAIAAEDEMERHRGIAVLLRHDLMVRDDISAEMRQIVLGRIDRYSARADEIAGELKKYRGF